MSELTAIAIRHVSFEDLGSLAIPIEEAGYRISYRDVGLHDLSKVDAIEPDLLVVLGGPIGADEDAQYPFLADEIRILSDRLAAGRATLGICLGAQLIARALGARVYSGPRKEIGWAPIQLSNVGRKSVVRHLDEDPVFHWHGDTFDLPVDCDLLASTEVCRNQAFRKGSSLLALQFHPEVLLDGFERWLIGHACELSAQPDVSCQQLRTDTAKYAPSLRLRAGAMIAEWLRELKP
jgi:GMP synthase (glutamine-hydrolysing)